MNKKGPGQLRIVGGIWRGRKFPVPPLHTVRPTSERAREAVFNRLIHAQDALGVDLRGAAVVDVFAGSGALGLEALSRGASLATFIDADPAVTAGLRRILSGLGAEDRARVLAGDATALPPAPQPHDIAFLDPPYLVPHHGSDLLAPALVSLAKRGWLKPGALIIAETEADPFPQLPPGFTPIDQRRYGRPLISFLRRDK
ncbi:MAG: 16S rRNA (guanine(966)-N(2))-methyltransferase RsmD [Rhodospirillaceae bacterium]|nr:16S rRNA (guanine(966)-N(2))-methyltransferase RsmD [Rhodospirillaceae bacterium]